MIELEDDWISLSAVDALRVREDRLNPTAKLRRSKLLDDGDIGLLCLVSIRVNLLATHTTHALKAVRASGVSLEPLDIKMPVAGGTELHERVFGDSNPESQPPVDGLVGEI